MLVYENASNQLVVNRRGVVNQQANITVVNLAGQKLMNVPTTGTNMVISKSFTPGVYLVTVTAGGKSTLKKVIIQ